MDRTYISLILNSIAAVTALIAAAFWFVSAHGTVTVDYTWAGLTENPKNFADAINRSAKWNSLAASFAGVSALCMGAAIGLGLFG